jgi:hypothetical protein
LDFRGDLIYASPLAWPIFRAVRAVFIFVKSIFLELSDMTDERRASTPTPYLRTGPATMLTAIGLCVLLMIMQLMPEMRDAGPLRSFVAADISR